MAVVGPRPQDEGHATGTAPVTKKRRLFLAAALLSAAACAAPPHAAAAPVVRLDGQPAEASFDWSELIRFAAPAAPFRTVEPQPQATGQNACVDPTNPNVSGVIYLGPTYNVPGAL